MNVLSYAIEFQVKQDFREGREGAANRGRLLRDVSSPKRQVSGWTPGHVQCSGGGGETI